MPFRPDSNCDDRAAHIVMRPLNRKQARVFAGGPGGRQLLPDALAQVVSPLEIDGIESDSPQIDRTRK
jgi:hypothetical protein